jgi:hypothetical protein
VKAGRLRGVIRIAFSIDRFTASSTVNACAVPHRHVT